MEQKERKAIGERIRQARLHRGWDIPALAQQASLSPKLLARLEAGTAEMTTLQLIHLAIALQTSTDALLKDELPTDTLQVTNSLTSDNQQLQHTLQDIADTIRRD